MPEKAFLWCIFSKVWQMVNPPLPMQFKWEAREWGCQWIYDRLYQTETQKVGFDHYTLKHKLGKKKEKNYQHNMW